MHVLSRVNALCLNRLAIRWRTNRWRRSWYLPRPSRSPDYRRSCRGTLPLCLRRPWSTPTRSVCSGTTSAQTICCSDGSGNAWTPSASACARASSTDRRTPCHSARTHRASRPCASACGPAAATAARTACRTPGSGGAVRALAGA